MEKLLSLKKFQLIFNELKVMNILCQHDIFYQILMLTPLPVEISTMIANYTGLPIQGALPQWPQCYIYSGVNAHQAREVLNIARPCAAAARRAKDSGESVNAQLRTV